MAVLVWIPILVVVAVVSFKYGTACERIRRAKPPQVLDLSRRRWL